MTICKERNLKPFFYHFALSQILSSWRKNNNKLEFLAKFTLFEQKYIIFKPKYWPKLSQLDCLKRCTLRQGLANERIVFMLKLNFQIK